MTDDIVNWLRAVSDDYGMERCGEAADEIEWLRGRLDAISKGAVKTLKECEKLDNWHRHGEGYGFMSEWVKKVLEERQ